MPVLTHFLTRRRLGAYLDGALDEEGARATAAHLRRCERCRGEVEHLRQLQGLIREAVPAPAPPDWAGFWAGIVRGVEESQRLSPGRRLHAWPRLGWRPGLAIAGVLVALLVGVVIWQPLSPPPAPEAPVVVRSAHTEIPGGSLMVYASPGESLAVVWVFDEER
jgi:anti-sigma factor RsiW